MTLTGRSCNLRLALLIAGVILSSTDTASSQWSRVGFPGNQIGAFLVKGDTILAGSQQEVFRSTNGGATWGPVGQLSSLAVSDFASDGDVFFAATNRARGCLPGTCSPLPTVFRSVNGGIHWDSVLAAVYGATQIQRTTTALYTNPDGALFRSTNGTTWEFVPVDTATLGLIEFVFTHGDTMYIDTRQQGLHKSTDGSTWTPCSNGLPGTAIFSMDSRGSTLFAVPAGFGVYTSTDHGVTWTPVNEGLSEPGSVHTVVSTVAGLFAASAESVYTADQANAWINITGDLSLSGFPFIARLAVTNDHLLAGTNDGIWRASLADLVTNTAGDVAPPATYQVHQNYPNPFNPSTTVRYDVPMRSYITISVFSLLGQNVATLLEQEVEPGRHSVTWVAEGFPSGIYLLRFSARPISQLNQPVFWERKMVLTR